MEDSHSYAILRSHGPFWQTPNAFSCQLSNISNLSSGIHRYWLWEEISELKIFQISRSKKQMETSVRVLSSLSPDSRYSWHFTQNLAQEPASRHHVFNIHLDTSEIYRDSDGRALQGMLQACAVLFSALWGAMEGPWVECGLLSINFVFGGF